MSTPSFKPNRLSTQESTFDRRDRLILALVAQLRAERQTREALESTIRNGNLSREVLTAMVGDPVPVITSEDVAEAERFLDRSQPGAVPRKLRETSEGDR